MISFTIHILISGHIFSCPDVLFYNTIFSFNFFHYSFLLDIDGGLVKTKKKSMLVNLLVQRANTRLGQGAEKTVLEDASASEGSDTNSPSPVVTLDSGDASSLDLSDATDSSLRVNVGSFADSRVLDDSTAEGSLVNQNASVQSLSSAGGYASPAAENSTASDLARECNTPESYLSAEE